MEIPDQQSPQLPIHDAISPGKSRPPTNIPHSRPPKRRGEEGELAFMRRAIAEDFAIAKPWGDSERYETSFSTTVFACGAYKSAPPATRCTTDSRFTLTSWSSAKWYGLLQRTWT